MSKKNTPHPSTTYANAGVDIHAGNRLIEAMKPLVAQTKRTGVLSDLGGFGGVFDLKACHFKDPLLVAATDGVGTKLEIAQNMNRHKELGIDVVAMCVNDILAQGATPLFFLDYVACAKLHPSIVLDIIAGICEGCKQAGCALIGGETAEMPGIYPQHGYDVAGFCVGAVERGDILTKDMVQEGDCVIALASSGLHANGFSLVRNLITEKNLDIFAPAPFAPQSCLGESLLTPTKIYAQAVQAALNTKQVTSISHITGGGLIENPPRVFGEHLSMYIDMRISPLPAIFAWLKTQTKLPIYDYAQIFNCGIGMLITGKADKAEAIIKAISHTGQECWHVGDIRTRQNKAVCLDYNETH